jgi:hypothetical protein
MRGISSSPLRVFAPASVLGFLISSLDRRLRQALCAAALAIAFTAPALAQQDLTGRALLSYQFFGSDGGSQNGFHQIYDAGYQRMISDPLRIQLFFRGEGNNSSQHFGLSESTSSFWRLQPYAEVDYVLPQLQFVGRYDAVHVTSNFSDNSGRDQFVRRGMGTLTWSPDALPSLMLHGEQFSNTDSLAGIDQTQSLVSQAVNYTWKGLTVGEFADYRTFDLNNTGFHRTAADVQLIGQLTGTFFGGHGSVSAQAVAGVTRLEESTTSSTSTSVPTQVSIASASFVHDETPLDSRDAPLAPAPTLIDRDFKTSAAISLGLDAPSFQNLVFDLGRFVGVDMLRIYVRDAAGNPVAFGGLVRWDVYTSSNRLDWTPIADGGTRFIVSISAYEVSFVKTSLRYFKVVSFGANSIETVATEVEAYFHTEFRANETRQTDVRFLTANLNLSGQVAPWLTLTYNGIFNDYKTLQPNRPDYASIDNDQQFSADFAPSHSLDLTLRYERRTVSPTGGQTDTLNGYWGILQYNFNPNLNTTVEASRTHELSALDITADTLRVSQYARFLDSLDLRVDGGVLRTNSAAERLQTKTTFFDGTSYIQLTRSLQLLVAANLLRTDFSGRGAEELGLGRQTIERYYGELVYRPSTKLTLSGRFGYSNAGALSGTIRAYRIEWYPFAGGTIGIGSIYDEDVDANHFSRRFRRLQILPTWQINRHAILTVNYNFLQLQNGATATTPATVSNARQFFVTLTLVL